LFEVLLSGQAEAGDVMELELPESERKLLASVLMQEEEELTAERLEAAVKALRRIQLRRRLEQVQLELQTIKNQQPGRLQELLAEKVRLKLALRDPVLAAAPSVSEKSA
jgi:uncharacterized protein YbaP (TraB family)